MIVLLSYCTCVFCTLWQGMHQGIPEINKKAVSFCSECESAEYMLCLVKKKTNCLDPYLANEVQILFVSWRLLLVLWPALVCRYQAYSYRPWSCFNIFVHVNPRPGLLERRSVWMRAVCERMCTGWVSEREPVVRASRQVCTNLCTVELLSAGMPVVSCQFLIQTLLDVEETSRNGWAPFESKWKQKLFALCGNF